MVSVVLGFTYFSFKVCQKSDLVVLFQQPNAKGICPDYHLFENVYGLKMGLTTSMLVLNI